MKTRFTSLDIAASIASFRDSLLGLRVSNVYDINPKCYLFKLAKPDKKEWLLIESGIRIHSTRFTREKNTIPSAFTLKLRKHLRTKRIEAIEQLGVDRVVKITFGTGAATQHLIIEFYASGNIILTDADLVILTVLRTHKYDDNTIVAPHNAYPLQTTKQFVPITDESLANILSADVPLTIKSEREDEIEEKNQPKSEMSLKVILSNETELGTLLIEHCLLKSETNPQAKLKDYDKQHNAKLLHELQAAQNIFMNKTNTGEGYILLHQGKPKASKKKSEKSIEENNNAAPAESQEALYDDFMPILFLQYVNRPHLKFGSFDEAIDEYFSKIESQKLTLQAAQQEASVLSKLDKVKKDQERRIEELNKNESLNRTKARLIEMNLKEVDQVLHIIRSAVASSMDWTKLNEIIKEEKKKGDPTANMIHKLNLEKNQVTLYLTNTSDDISDEELSSPACLVDIDLSLSAHANATYYFDLKKKSNMKAKKTTDAAEQAVKAAEKKTRTALKEVKVKTEIKHARKPLWFEKFNWFITTDNFLIISGKDMQQNEQLYRRYLKKGDLYIHADLSGAASCIVKNPNNAVIPPSTLLQAGDFSVCHSAAWNEKIVTSAWWVEKDQVSKTAPSGEFLTTGSFMIRGKKNYLPPSTLILGFGIMFKLHEESIAKHKALRKQTQAAFSDNENQNKEDDTELQVDESDQNEAEPEPLKGSGQTPQTTEQPTSELKLLGSDHSHLRSLGFGVQNSDDLESDIVESESSVSKKKRTSAKERRQMKKGQTNSSENQDSELEGNSENAQPEETSSKEKQSKAPLPRGKRSKEKKAKEKYKDQDDEERSLKMQLLGSVGKQPEKQDKQPPKQTPKQNNATQKKKQEPPKPKPTTTNPQTNEEEEEVKNILKEENLNEIDDDKDKSVDLDLLDSLTGAPLPDDILLFCVPVCGPYSAMNNFKYKVKLTPGSAKRGKAIKTILKFFLHNENITPQERDLIKNMPEQEAIQQIVGNVKISTPGLFAQTKKGKHD